MELKPCPFCGGKPMLRDFEQRRFFEAVKVYYYVQCPCCDVRTSLDEEPLIVEAKWNGRADNG